METANKPKPTIDLKDIKVGELTYYDYGRISAMNSLANIDLIDSCLANLYDDIMLKNKLTDDQIQKKINQLDDEVLKIEKDIAQKKNEIQKNENTIDHKKKMIKDVQEKILDIKKHLPPFNYVMFGAGVFIVVLLTLYLFVFYASTGYSAFYGVEDSTSFIHAGVFKDAKKQGGEVLAIFVLFPMIFLALGFLIHDFLEKKKHLALTGLLCFTLIFDVLLAYKIAEGIHANKLMSGETTETWQPSLAFTDVNFWIIIAAGFVVYILWGLMLHKVMHDYKMSQPGVREQQQLINFNNDIKEHEADMLRLQNEIEQFKADIVMFEKEKDKKLAEKRDYLSGKIQSIITNTKLEGAVGDFFSGWSAFIAFHWKDSIDVRENLTNKSKLIADKWTAKKLSEQTITS